MTGDELKAWRSRNGVSQGELMKLTGASRSTVKNWERGTTPIPFPVQVLCKAAEGKIAAWRNAVEC